MYKKTLKSVINAAKEGSDSVKSRKPHFIFSAENPLYPVKYSLDAKGVRDLLTRKGYKFDEIQGQYGQPEKSILVHNPSKEAVRHLQDLAHGLGQESSIYSDGYNHELHFHHGENAGKHMKGQGTTWHKRQPTENYSTLKDGTHFSHVFGQDMHEEETSMLKPEGYIRKSEDSELTLIHYSPEKGLTAINPQHQGTRIRDSASKYGRPEHPMSFFYRPNSPTEDLVTQGSQSKYLVKVPAHGLYDIGTDPDAVYQTLKQSGKTLNPGIVSRDDLHGELKRRGYHGFYNSTHEREDMRGVVGLYHETPVVHEESLTKNETIAKAIQSPSKHIGLNRLKQIKADNGVGAGGQEYSEEELGDAINERQNSVANKMVRDAGKQEKQRALDAENEAKGIGGALPSDFPWLNKKPIKPINIVNKGNDKIRQVADQYAQTKGLTLQHNMPPVKVDEHRAGRIAEAFHNAKHEPQAPHVQQAYNALIGETNDQFKHMLGTGLKISKIQPGQENPYKSSKDLFHDIHNNNHIWYYPTDQGFGSNPNQDASHPMLQPTEHVDNEGKPMLANDVFRIVHDYFGHAKEGHGFGAHGEENAWKNHMQMFSPMAQKALTAETRGQNSWVNYGPHGEHNRKNPGQTIYADQKATLLPDWAMDGAHHSVYQNLGKSELSGKHLKRLDIMKGAMQKLAPYDPGKHSNKEEHKRTENWTKESFTDPELQADARDHRAQVPSMHANAKVRALHKLTGKTQVRRHPKTGERMFLLHRGMAESEFQTNHINGMANYAPNTFTSWTPRYDIASGFASDHIEDGTKPRVVSAWIPESQIHNVPNQTMIPDENAQFRNEHEVIVQHNGNKMPHAHPNIIALAKDPRKDLNSKINMKGVAEQARKEPGDAWERDHQKMVQRQQSAEAYKKQKFGKREAITTPTLSKSDISSKIKSGLAGLAIAASTLSPVSTSSIESNKPEAQEIAQVPKPPTMKEKILSGIKQIESSGGKNTNHKTITKPGMMHGDRAYGNYGLMPIIIKETVKKDPGLMKQHGKILTLTGDDVHEYMDKNPGLQDKIASKHYDRIAKYFGDSPHKIGYAWLNGIAGTMAAINAKKSIAQHHYVKKLMKELKPAPHMPASPVKPLKTNKP